MAARKSTKKFTAEVVRGHKGCAFILPFDPAKVWGRRERHFVRGSLNGRAFDGEVGHRWGRFFVCLDDDLLDALAMKPGDALAVVMTARKPNELDPEKLPRLPSARLVAQRARRSR